MACDTRDWDARTTSASWFIRSERSGASDNIARIR